MDVRDILPQVRTPTLVIHRADDSLVEARQGRYLAEHIPNARYVELDGTDHWPWIGNPRPVIDAIATFVHALER